MSSLPASPQRGAAAANGAASGAQRCLICDGTLRPSPSLPGLMQCEACGFITANLDIPDVELERLYSEKYFNGEEYSNYVSDEETLNLNFARRLDTLKSLAPDLASKSAYEIGCAYGFFLNVARNVFKNVAGIDVSGDAVTYAKQHFNLDVASGDYLNANLTKPYDVFCLWDTIEHLRVPHLYIEKAAREINPGGLIAITTGDIGSLNARFRGPKWRMIHPPTHLHYFSAATLAQLLERNGFEIVHLSHPGSARTLRAILHGVLVLGRGNNALFKRLLDLPGLGTTVTLNLLDIMFMVGRKRAV